MDRYRGVVIGCGKIGALFETDARRPLPRSHAGALREHPKTVLAGFVDADQARLLGAQSLFPGVSGFNDFNACLEQLKPDIAIVAVNTEAHASAVSACASAGVPMIIGEKPLAADLAQARSLQRAIEKSDSVFVLNYQRRFFPLFIKAKEAIHSGRIGTVRQVTCYYDNGLFNNGGHAIDAISFLTEAQIDRVAGYKNKSNATHPAGDQNIDGMLFSDAGLTIALQSFDQKRYGIHELHLYGEKGALIIRDYGYDFEWIGFGPSASPVHEREARSMTADVLEEVIASYEQKRQPQSGIKNGIETLAVLEAVRSSAENGGALTTVVYTERI